MWYLDFSLAYNSLKSETNFPKINNFSNLVYKLNKKEDIVKYLSTAMQNPVPQTWIQAIDASFFSTWPGLTSKLVRKYLQQ